jgi:hypothetical protein
LFLCIRIAKLGYYGGSPDSVKDAPVDTIIGILQYEKFESEYTETARELNNEDK